MEQITQIQKRLEKLSLDLKQSQNEVRELSNLLADLERNSEHRAQTNEDKGLTNKTKKPTVSKAKKLYTYYDITGYFNKINYHELMKKADNNSFSDLSVNSVTNRESCAFNVVLCSMLRFVMSYSSIYFCARVYTGRSFQSESFLSMIQNGMKLDIEELNHQIYSLKSYAIRVELLERMLDMAFMSTDELKKEALKYTAAAASMMKLSENTIKIAAESAAKRSKIK